VPSYQRRVKAIRVIRPEGRLPGYRRGGNQGLDQPTSGEKRVVPRRLKLEIRTSWQAQKNMYFAVARRKPEVNGGLVPILGAAREQGPITRCSRMSLRTSPVGRGGRKLGCLIARPGSEPLRGCRSGCSQHGGSMEGGPQQDQPKKETRGGRMESKGSHP